MKLLIRILYFLFVLNLLTGCSDSESSSEYNELTLNKVSVSILTGNTFQLSASKNDVTWSSDDSSIATVNQSGLVTGISKGQTNVSATTLDDKYTAKCVVTVTDSTVEVTAVELNIHSAEIIENTTLQLSDTVLPVNATNQNVTWKSSNTGVATVDSTGLVTAKRKGTARITVTTDDNSKTDKCNLTVKEEPVSATGVNFNRTSLNILKGASVQLEYSMEPSNATNVNVTWSVSDTNIAEVSSSGLVYGKNNGEADVKVTTEDGGFEAVCHIIINDSPLCTSGYVERGMLGTVYPCYWINSTAYELETLSNYDTVPIHIAVSNGTVYNLGYYENRIWDVKKICYWENGNIYYPELPAGSNIVFSPELLGTKDEKICIGGTYDIDNKTHAAYWIGTTRYDFPMPDGFEIGTAVYFEMMDNGKVFCSAGLWNRDTSEVKKCYWVGSEYHELDFPDGAVNLSYNSHIISGEDVYIFYNYQTFPGAGKTYYYTSLWKNGVRTDPYTADMIYAQYGHAKIVDGNLYFLGRHETDSSDKIGCYWKNGTSHDLEIPSGGNGVVLKAIAVSGSSVYVTGHYDMNGKRYVCYWKDSVRHDVGSFDDDTDNSYGLTGAFLYNDEFIFSYDDKPYFWNNDNETSLTFPSDFMGFRYLSYIGYSGNNCFIRGYYTEVEDKERCCLWINETPYAFSSESTVETISTHEEMILSDGSIYQHGRINNDACYWINTDLHLYEKLNDNDKLYPTSIMKP